MTRELFQSISHVLDESISEFHKEVLSPEFRMPPEETDDLLLRGDTADAMLVAGNDFVKSYKRQYHQAFFGGEDVNVLTDTYGSRELSLLAHDDLELSISLARYVQRINEQNSETLLHLKLRLELYLEDQNTPVNLDLFYPEAFYEPFQMLVDELDISIDSKLMLFRLFHEKLSIKLPNLYSKLNEQLIESGYLASERTINQALVAYDQAQRELAVANMQVEGDSSVRQGFKDNEAANAESNASEQHAAPAGGVAASQQGFAPPGAGISAGEAASGSSAAAQGFQNAGAPGQRPGAGQSAEQGGIPPATGGFYLDEESVNYLMQHISPGGRARPMAMQIASHAPFVNALSTLQQTPTSGEQYMRPEKIKENLHKVMIADSNGASVGITTSEEKLIDFVNQLYQKIYDDPQLNDALKTLLAKLQVPIIKLALLDFNFFRDPYHPARRLLNDLTRIGVGINSKDDPLFAQLNGIINSILKGYKTDHSVFKAALKKLHALFLEEQKSARLDDERLKFVRSNARKVAAKRAVIHHINRHLYQKKLPRAAVQFLTECWAPYMAGLYLHNGIQSEQWRDAIMLMRQIIEAAQPVRNIAEVEQLLGVHERFFGNIRETLESVKDDDSIIEALKRGSLEKLQEWFKEFEEQKIVEADQEEQKRLEEMLSQNIPIQDTQEFRLSTSVVDIAIFPEEQDQRDIVAERARSLIEQLPAQVQPGKWFEVFQGEGVAKRRAKLNTILDETGQLVFVTRNEENFELDVDTFLKDFRANRSNVIEDSNRFDKALSAVISAIRTTQQQETASVDA